MEEQQDVSSEMREKENIIAKRRDGKGMGCGVSEGQPTWTLFQREPQKLASRVVGQVRIFVMGLMNVETEIEIYKSSCGEIKKRRWRCWGERKVCCSCKLKVVTAPSIPYVCLQKIHWKGTETRASRQTGHSCICMCVIPYTLFGEYLTLSERAPPAALL